MVIIISTHCEGQHMSNFLTQCLFKKKTKKNKNKTETKQNKKTFSTLYVSAKRKSSL